MPKYFEAFVYKTVNLECKVIVEASDEGEASDKIFEMIDKGEFIRGRFEEVGSEIEFDGFVEEVE